MRSLDEITRFSPDGRAFSNHSQFDYWADRWCYRCVHDDGETEQWCPILSAAMLGKIPAEWIALTDEDRLHGTYTCTEFTERGDDGDPPEPNPEPVPQCPGQVNMFEIFADQIIEQAGQLEGGRSWLR